MNPFLAELYNTAENIGTGAPTVDDTEKLAQAAVLDQMLKNEGFAVENLSPQDIVKVATEIFGADSPLVKEAMEGGLPPAFLAGKKDEGKKDEGKKDEKKEEEEDEKKEAQAKLDESDFLGRAMAHAYVDELRTIEKQAAAGTSPQPPAGVPSTLASLLNKDASAQSQEPSSAVDILARQRAEEMLKAAGVQPGKGQNGLDSAVQARAEAMLKEAGYKVE